MSSKDSKNEVITPPQIIDAVDNGDLVIFVGAGVSKLAGCPSWDEFSNSLIEDLRSGESGSKEIDYELLDTINTISDIRKRISITMIIGEQIGHKFNMENILQPNESDNEIYSYLNSFDCTFVTTNYDKLICPDINRRPSGDVRAEDAKVGLSEGEWRIFGSFDKEDLKRRGNVIHLHGCIDDQESMIMTTKDYYELYSSPMAQGFLKELFNEKVVLFLGYGLEEPEILEYVCRYKSTNKPNAFVLQGFFDKDKLLKEQLMKYYKSNLGVELIPFSRNKNNYGELTSILKSWKDDFRMQEPTIVDETQMLLQDLGL
jgi:hypothetical protein